MAATLTASKLNIVSPTPPDIEIAQAVKCEPIAEIAAKLGLTDDMYEPHGHDKAKVCISSGGATPATAYSGCYASR
jgi:hypothetical protein